MTQLNSTCKGCRVLNHVPSRLPPGHHLNPKDVFTSFSMDIFYLPIKKCAENIVGQGPPEQLKFSAFLTIVDLKSGFIFASYLPKQTEREIINALNNFFLNTSCSAQFFHSNNAANLIKK